MHHTCSGADLGKLCASKELENVNGDKRHHDVEPEKRANGPKNMARDIKPAPSHEQRLKFWAQSDLALLLALGAGTDGRLWI